LPDGQALAFTAPPTTGDNGLYRGQAAFDGVTTTGGWIVLSSTEQAGAVLQGGDIIASPQLNTGQPTVHVDGVGVLAVQHVDKFINIADVP
jgi:hypothetical protein